MKDKAANGEVAVFWVELLGSKRRCYDKLNKSNVAGEI